MSDRSVARRTFLAGALAATGLGLIDSAPASAATVGAPTRWSQLPLPSGPGPIVIDQHVLLDVDVAVPGLVVLPSGVLEFDPLRSRRLASAGNVVVNGALVMVPSGPGIDHLLQLTGAVEANVVGATGGMGVLDSDVGLWVRPGGTLTLRGSTKTAWVRARAGLAAGATQLALAEAPTGWSVGDELAVSPSSLPSRGVPDLAFEIVRVVNIVGDTVTVDRPLAKAHPLQEVMPGYRLGPEILNLTRNVRVEGLPGRRAHVHVMNGAPVFVSGTALRHLGPRHDTTERDRTGRPYTTGILGRYGFHIHMAGDLSRGSLIEGVVARDIGSHAFVPHGSHGVTMRSCISFDTLDDAYWWDQAASTREPQVATDDLRLEGCVAALVRVDPDFRGQRLTGFSLGRGVGNAATDCVAVGVLGSVSSSGFSWPEGGIGIWSFKGCVAHNNARNGLFVWQNTGAGSVIDRFTAYANGASGVEHGAYQNGFRYRQNVYFGNGLAGFTMIALGSSSPTVLEQSWIDGAGVSPDGVVFGLHLFPGATAQEVSGNVIKGHTRSCFRFANAPIPTRLGPDWVDIWDNDASGTLVSAVSELTLGSSIRMRDRNEGTLRLRAVTETGALRTLWNVRTLSDATLNRPPAAFQPFLIAAARKAPMTARSALSQRIGRLVSTATPCHGACCC